MSTLTPRDLRVTRSWGSHGYSVYGVYWERWTLSVDETMSEAEFVLAAASAASDILTDQKEMRDGDQRSLIHLKRVEQ